MSPHVCPWWGGYFIDNRLRRLFHKPEKILAPYLQPGMTAMDLGCGMGMFAIAMARLVGDSGRVIAVDLQQQMLDVLQKRAAKAGVAGRLETHCCEKHALGLTAQVDFILGFYSVHEMPGIGRVLGEVHACLRPGGRFLVVEPVGHVTRTAFADMIARAEELAMAVVERPRVTLSRAALLEKR